MATTTQNLGLIKPAGTDKIRIAQINSNMDTIDTKMGPVGSTPLQTQATNAASSISALQRSMAIVCNGNTHAAIPSGSYAYVRNHSSLAEGLYQATAAIAANATLSSSNLSAVSGGGLNTLSQNITQNINSEIARGFSNTFNTLEEFNSFLANETSGRRSIARFEGDVTNFFLESRSSSQAIVGKADVNTADMFVFSLGAEKAALIRYTFSKSTIAKRKYFVLS